ncbi:hypothetical protein H0H87_010026 [Tephrocybe sp. NHM501043]|nr:hypothetical protein H0H87_010026 [Tephrocybe sp. NHM501043]
MHQCCSKRRIDAPLSTSVPAAPRLFTSIELELERLIFHSSPTYTFRRPFLEDWETLVTLTPCQHAYMELIGDAYVLPCVDRCISRRESNLPPSVAAVSDPVRLTSFRIADDAPTQKIATLLVRNITFCMLLAWGEYGFDDFYPADKYPPPTG